MLTWPPLLRLLLRLPVYAALATRRRATDSVRLVARSWAPLLGTARASAADGPAAPPPPSLLAAAGAPPLPDGPPPFKWQGSHTRT